MRNRVFTVVLFILMFGVSSESQAFLEWLHKLSGPGPYIGLRPTVRFECVKTPGTDERDCGFLEGGLGFYDPDKPPSRRWTFSLTGGFLRSSDNDLLYEEGVAAPRVWIWSLEPTAEVWFTRQRDLFFALGRSLNSFQGERFEDFRNDSWTARFGVRKEIPDRAVHALEFGVKYSVFDDRFSPEDFGALPGPSEERTVAGFFATVFFWN